MNIAEEAWLYGCFTGIGIGVILDIVGTQIIDRIIEGRTNR